MPSSDLPFADFLATLRRHDFPIGVDHYLRIRRLLGRMDQPFEPYQLRTLLCPLIATNGEEQARFYAVFDQYYGPRPPPIELPPSTPAPTPAPASASRPSWRGRPSRSGVIIAAAVTLLLMRADTLDRPPTQPTDPCAGPRPTAADSCQTPGPDTTEVVPPAERVLALTVTAEPPTWYQDNYRGVLAGALGVPLGLFALGEVVLRRRRRRPGSKPQAPPTPPYHWTIRAPPAAPWYRGPEFALTARMLRAREAAETERLDVERSIAATIDGGGFPVWKFRSDTRPPEYLLLVDRASPRDHQASHYASVAHGLKEQGLFVERRFFDRDPRLCSGEPGSATTSLRELARRYPSARLVLFGAGDGLLDPLSGELAAWTSELETWADRAILTPLPAAAWGPPETVLLAERLLVRPGTLEGLRAVAYDFDTDTGPNRRQWRRRSSDGDVPSLEGVTDLAELRGVLGPELFRWLCATAVYPELHWDLTVYLGHVLTESAAPPLVTESNLLALARLPWFRAGRIPDRERARLIAALDPETRRKVHEQLASLLEKDPPKPDSFAAERHAENLALQRLGTATDAGERRALRADLRRLAPDRLLHEAAVAGLEAELPRSRLARLVPRRWWRWVFEAGDPLYPIRLGGRAAAAAAVAFLAVAELPKPAARDTSLAFEPDSITLAPADSTWRISVVADSGGIDTIAPALFVEDTAVAFLAGDGRLRARAAGTTRLRAVHSSDTAWAAIAVVGQDVVDSALPVPAAPVALSGIAAVTRQILIGEALQLEPVLTLDDSAVTVDRALRWTSSDAAVARVSAGIVTGRTPGKARITVADSAGARATIVISVLDRRAGPRDTLEEAVLFEPDGATVRLRLRRMLDRKVRVLRDYPTARIRLGAHTDDRGSDRLNLALSFRLAAGVRDYLVAAGTAASRIETVSYGEDRPLVKGRNAVARAVNRRLEVVVIADSFVKPTDTTSEKGIVRADSPVVALPVFGEIERAIRRFDEEARRRARTANRVTRLEPDAASSTGLRPGVYGVIQQAALLEAKSPEELPLEPMPEPIRLDSMIVTAGRSAAFEVHNTNTGRYVLGFVRPGTYPRVGEPIWILPAASSEATCVVQLPLAQIRSPRPGPGGGIVVELATRTRLKDTGRLRSPICSAPDAKGD